MGTTELAIYFVFKERINYKETKFDQHRVKTIIHIENPLSL